MTLLDVGCGPETLTADLARLVEPGQVVELDSPEDVLAEARSMTASQSNIETRGGKVYALDFPDGVFEVVHPHRILQHLTDPVAGPGRDETGLPAAGPWQCARSTTTWDGGRPIRTWSDGRRPVGPWPALTTTNLMRRSISGPSPK